VFLATSADAAGDHRHGAFARATEHFRSRYAEVFLGPGSGGMSRCPPAYLRLDEKVTSSQASFFDGMTLAVRRRL